MNRRLIAKGAALAACIMLGAAPAPAEEKRLGDYIYVPAMTVRSMSGTIGLRLEGLALDELTGEPVIAESVAGAEFGVYVISGDGELTPWANPLYPSEPMRIRTGEGETSFTLPQGTEFYLRQERAPQGYLFDETALIPVTGEEIVVRNEMAGQLLLSARDSLGNPIAGVEMTAVDEDGTVHVLRTDENGDAQMLCEQAQVLSVAETALPQGVYAAKSISGAQQTQDGALHAQVFTATRTHVVFEHPASGTVQLNMQLSVIDDQGEKSLRPLKDVRLDILGAQPLSVITDEQGQASVSLLEGTYDVLLSYEGREKLILPVEQGQTIVASGSTTLIELTAVETTGRVLVKASCLDTPEGSFKLVSDETGKSYGPYKLDADGVSVSQALPAGVYRIAEFKTPSFLQFGSVSSGTTEQSDPRALALTVEAGGVTPVDVNLLTFEEQTFDLLIASIDEQGTVQHTKIEDSLSLTLLPQDGGKETHIRANGGTVAVEALSGVYRLALSDKDAAALGVQAVSGAFEMPSREDAVVFSSDCARLLITSADEHGAVIPGAQYAVTDSRGEYCEIACDEDGMAVTPLLAAGDVYVETIASPKAHDRAEAVTVSAEAGKVTAVEMMHPAFALAQFTVRLQSLNEQGNAQRVPLEGIAIQLYSVAKDGQRMTAVDAQLLTDEAGKAEIRLEPGEYVARIDGGDADALWSVPQALRFTAENMQTTGGELVCMDRFGGVRVELIGGELSDLQMAQIRFELTTPEGETSEVSLVDGLFYAGGLPAGTYVLRQTQMPQGYTLASEQTFSVEGGTAASVAVPLEECAVLSVLKTGLTFDDALKTYIVPLTGEYGVYTLADGEMKPYPNEKEQMTVWANVSPEQVAMGRSAQIRLPAALSGTTYYLHEIGDLQGFSEDENYYEVVLHAGEERMLECAVSSDRGFFSFDMLDAGTGEHVPGGVFELINPADAETVLTFETGEGSYRNAMAIPVGSYVLRQTQAGEGYALSMQPEIQISIEPYLTQGGTVTPVQMTAARIPQAQQMDLIKDLYVTSAQGLTLLSLDTGATEPGMNLYAPKLEIKVDAQNGERTDIASVAITGAGDSCGGEYVARVEYCLAGGGWRPSDARETGVLTGPTAVSLSDVQDDICAVRISFVNAATGEEAVCGGFTPGQVSLSVEGSAQGELNMTAEAAFDGVFAYQTAFGGEVTHMARAARHELSFAMHGDGFFDTVSAGRDGVISGVAFFDEDADGVMDLNETGRYAGLAVSLVAQSGEVMDTVRTAADGTYRFGPISSGTYTVQFDAGGQVVFTRGDLFSAHRISSVADMRYGTSEELYIDGDHTDYVVNAGCVYAAQVSGGCFEQTANGLFGFGGLGVELRALPADEEEEPILVVTDDTGAFSVNGLLPGTYEISVEIPQGYLSAGEKEGAICMTLGLDAGEVRVFDPFVIAREASVSGAVRIDDDGDGRIADGAAALEGVRVALVGVQDGQARQIRETTTGADGAYAFEKLCAGEYSVFFELDGEWAFTRYGGDSLVYGAVSQSGTTKNFTLVPGETRTNVDAGATIPAELSVSVFKDTQYDGQKGSYEDWFADVEVSLIRLEDGEDAQEVTYKTNEEGSVVFAGVSPGEYVISYQLPGQWRATRQVDPRQSAYPVSDVPQSTSSSGRSHPFTLSMGQSGIRMYIGAMLSGSISGRVYYDDDDDAQIGAQESFCPDVLVELLSRDGELVASAKTGADGTYAFEGIAPTRYRVRFTAQEGCGFSGTERTMAKGGVEESDSHVSQTRLIPVSGGEATTTADAGIVRLGSVSGVIWEDRNADCVQDSQENGLAGIAVMLMNGSGSTVLEEAETDADGRFSFAGLRPGTYKLRVDCGDGYVFSGAQAGSLLPLDQIRGERGYSGAFTLLGGTHVEQIGYGMFTQGVVSGRIWQDEDYDGFMGEREEGLRGAEVVLRDAQGREAGRTETMRSGEFSFEQLTPGEYTLEVTLEEGYVFTADGGESLAAHADGASSSIELGVLDMGASIEQLHIGALRPAAAGGVVWYDQDDDGRRQEEDEGVAGVRAVLTMTSGADTGLSYETVTDDSGAYSFTGLMPGMYRIDFELKNGHAFAKQVSGTRRVSVVPGLDACSASAENLEAVSAQTNGDLDVGVVGVGVVGGTVWEDSDYDGMLSAQESGVFGASVELIDRLSGAAEKTAVTDESGAYEIDFVRTGEYVLRVTLPDGRVFTREGESRIAMVDSAAAETASFSLEMGESAAGMHIGAIVPARVTGSVLVDENEDGVCGPQESGFAGAVVTAMQGGTSVAAARTQEDGSFAFDMLRPGEYRLRYALDDTALFARGVSLNMADEDAAEGETGSFALAMGDALEAEPVPVVRAARIAGLVFEDEDVSGRPDAQENAMTGVLVGLLDENGRSIDWTKTAADGGYAFERLRSGTYTLSFVIDEKMLFTDYSGEYGASCVPVVPGNAGSTQPFALAMGENLNGMHVGCIEPGSIGDTVWMDLDGNGLQDYKEPLVPGVSLTLMRADGEVVQTVTSDRYGYYAFRQLRPGDYVIRFDAQEGDSLTCSYGEPLGEIDSDIDPDTGMTAVVHLRSGQAMRNIDVGLTEHAD